MSADFPPPPPPKSPGAQTPHPPPPPVPTSDDVPPLSFSLTPFPPPPPPPPAPAPAAPPAPLPPPAAKLSPKARRALFAGTAAVVLAIVAAILVSHFRQRVPESALVAWLRAESSTRLSFDSLTTKIVPQSDGSAIVKFEGRGVLPAPLYRRENTAAYLRRTLDLSLASPPALRDALAAANDPQVRQRAGISDTPPDPLQAVVLRETAAAGASFPFAGVATASRVAGKWHFSLLQGTLSQPSLEGEPRESFEGKTYLAGTPGDDDALRQLVNGQADFVARIEKASTELAAENKRDRESRLARFHEILAPGALFTGRITNPDTAAGEPIVLEITSARSGSRQVAALLRNGGGWSDARPFLGTWKLDDATGAFSLNLMSRSGQAIADAGPLTGHPEAVSLALQLTGDGRLVATNESDVALEALRVDPADLDETKTRLSARLSAALEATRPDTLYHGTVTAKASNTAENILLRFTRQNTAGTQLAATFEAADAGATGKRALTGAVVDNTHRAGNAILRLQMPGGGRSRSARPGTLFAHATDATPALSLDGNRLAGADDTFQYEFTRISAQQAAVLKKNVPALTATDAAPAATPALPRATGVYVLIDGQWTSLPRNGGSSSQGLGGIARGLFSRNKDADKPATLIFKGDTPPPVVAGGTLTLTFKGKLPSRAKGVAIEYPLIEAAPTTTQEDGTRTAPLERFAGNFSGFGAARLPATLAQPAADLLTLTFDETLAPGTYAVLVGTDGYEFTVE